MFAGLRFLDFLDKGAWPGISCKRVLKEYEELCVRLSSTAPIPIVPGTLRTKMVHIMADYANWLDLHTDATQEQLTGRHGVLDVIARSMSEDLAIEKVRNLLYELKHLLYIVISRG